MEDHPSLLTQVAGLLLSSGFNVVHRLPDGERLREAMEVCKPDLVVMDITLPGTCGIELARQIRNQPQAPKVVMLTVHADADYVQAALGAGAAGFVVKSCLASDLVPALRSALADEIFVSGGIDPHASLPPTTT